MKPRLVKGWNEILIFVSLPVRTDYGWWCSGGDRSEWGATPQEAYAKWEAPRFNPYLIRQWAPFTAVEQYIYPQSPTLWQRFKRWCDSSHWDPSARIG